MIPEDIPASARGECSTCHAPIAFAIVVGAKSPTPKPFNIAQGSNGTHRLEVTGNTANGLRAVSVKASLAFGVTTLHLLHFATCPQKDSHRRTPRAVQEKPARGKARSVFRRR